MAHAGISVVPQDSKSNSHNGYRSRNPASRYPPPRVMPVLHRFLSLFLVASLAALPLVAMEPLPSTVFHWPQMGAPAPGAVESAPLLRGTTLDLEDIAVDAVVQAPGASQHFGATGRTEILLIVKDGRIQVELGGVAKALGPGGVAYALPDDRIEVNVPDGTPAQYYVFRYTTRQPGDPVRGAAAGGSFLLPWEAVHFEPSDRGGYRQQCRRATCLFDTFEMHVTTLNPDLFNHDIHTHRAEEMVLMIKGDVEMQIDGKTVKARKGDVMFLGANVPHGLLHNLGDEPTEYFAFQWWQ